jgi:hypothetical protein
LPLQMELCMHVLVGWASFVEGGDIGIALASWSLYAASLYTLCSSYAARTFQIDW